MLHPYRNVESDSAFYDLAVLRVEPAFNFTDSSKITSQLDRQRKNASFY
jgi:hypothetical protein